MRIAITGATGLVGVALATYLEGAGHEVHRVRRGVSDDRLADWNPAVGWIRPGALDGCDAIVHLAGEPIAGRSTASARWTPAMREKFSSSRRFMTSLSNGIMFDTMKPSRAEEERYQNPAFLSTDLGQFLP